MSVTAQGPGTKSLLWGWSTCGFRSLWSRFLHDTIAWERIGWLILTLGCLTCLLPKDEKAKHSLFHISFYVGEELPGVLGSFGKGRDLEKLPGSTWHLCSLLRLWPPFSSLRVCTSWGLVGGGGCERWKEWRKRGGGKGEG